MSTTNDNMTQVSPNFFHECNYYCAGDIHAILYLNREYMTVKQAQFDIEKITQQIQVLHVKNVLEQDWIVDEKWIRGYNKLEDNNKAMLVFVKQR